MEATPDFAKDRLIFISENQSPFIPSLEYRSIIWREHDMLVSGERRIKLPTQNFILEEVIASNKIDLWEPVLRWLGAEIGLNGILMFSADDALREIGLLAMARKSFYFGLYFDKAPSRVIARDYPVYGSAGLFIFGNTEVEQAFRKVYVPWYNGITADAEQGHLVKALETEFALRVQPVLFPQSETGLRILLIAYFSGPARTVGVQRINYWHRQIPLLWSGASVTLATASPWEEPDGTVLRVTDLGAGCLLRQDGSLPRWAQNFLENEKADAKSVSTLANCWRIGLENHFETVTDHYDVVIISGNPFAVFDFAAFAKRRWSARVILDYRDPFANNPRMGYKPEAREWARYLEKGYNFQADLVTVVNEDCALLVEGREDVPVVVVKNGFDETVLPAPLPRWGLEDDRAHFIHTGTLYPGRSPDALLEGLAALGHRFHHVGNPGALEKLRVPAEVLNLYGTCSYFDTLKLISRADCGVVFVHDNGFDTPTKLFDYVAYGIDILILTNGDFRAGAVGKLVEGVERVFWAKNTPEGIAEFLRDYRPYKERRHEAASAPFSRRASTEGLLEAVRTMIPDRW
jgi:glycosyltransferase involved in cell wall biosynthesis